MIFGPGAEIFLLGANTLTDTILVFSRVRAKITRRNRRKNKHKSNHEKTKAKNRCTKKKGWIGCEKLLKIVFTTTKFSLLLILFFTRHFRFFFVVIFVFVLAHFYSSVNFANWYWLQLSEDGIKLYKKKNQLHSKLCVSWCGNAVEEVNLGTFIGTEINFHLKGYIYGSNEILHMSWQHMSVSRC